MRTVSSIVLLALISFASAHMFISSSSSPWSMASTDSTGIRSFIAGSMMGPNSFNGNKDMCGVSQGPTTAPSTTPPAGGMATASRTRLAVAAGNTIGGNIFVLFYHGPPAAEISFMIAPGTNPDFSGTVGQQAWGTTLLANMDGQSFNSAAWGTISSLAPVGDAVIQVKMTTGTGGTYYQCLDIAIKSASAATFISVAAVLLSVTLTAFLV
jgi:hypothetical protein